MGRRAAHGLCMDGECVDGGTCTNTPNSRSCDDGDSCTESDTCSGGLCVGTRFRDCSDGDPCTDDECVGGGCQNPYNTAPCNDGNACTENDTCSGGTCSGTPIDCDDANSCSIEVGCDTMLGCLRNWVDCNDGDPCTYDNCDPATAACANPKMWPDVDYCDPGPYSVTPGEPPGGRIFVNNDDDNGNGIPDCEELTVVNGEDDLVAVSFSIGGSGQFEGCTHDPSDYTWRVAGSSFGFYLDSNKTEEAGVQPISVPSMVYMEGQGHTDACGRPARFEVACPGVYRCWAKSDPIQVVAVASLEWEVGAAGNPPLDYCYNNGGKRMFPGKTSPEDPDAADRRKVKLVATIAPPIEGVTVYFKVWDVDDPFDQLHGPGGANDVPNVNLIDSNTIGNDNRGTDSAPATFFAVTDEFGQASGTFTVSMQPGDNYRAAASCLHDAINQTDQTDADALSAGFDSPTQTYYQNGDFAGYKVPVVWSRMLTVWRKLHVEIDSMNSESTELADRIPDWDQVVVDAASVGNNVTTFTVRGQTQGTGQLASNEIDHYEGGTLTFSGLSLTLRVLSSRDIPQAGYFVAEIVVEGELTPSQQVAVVGLIPDLRDDDPAGGQLPSWYSVSADNFIRSAYQKAYIEIVDLEPQYNPNTLVAFDSHLSDAELWTGVGYDNSQDVWSSDLYWAALLVFGYQPGRDISGGEDDWDADPYTGTPNNCLNASNPNYDAGGDFGVTVEDSDNASVIFVESQRDIGHCPPKDYSHTIAHEIGHSCGGNTSGDADHDEFGLMTEGAPTNENSFSAQTLLRFRSSTRW